MFLFKENYLFTKNHIIMFMKILEKIRIKRKARQRKERLSEQEELIFLGCASDRLIEKYIHNFSFSNVTENKILELCSNEVVAYYLHRHSVNAELECKILDDEYLASIYLHQHSFGSVAQRKILKPQYAKLLALFVEEGYSFFDEEETFFARVAADELIEKYLQISSVLPKTLQILAERDPKWLVFYAKRYDLPREMGTDFIKAASIESFDDYIHDHSFSAEACLYLIESGDEERIKKYITRHYLTDDESDDARAEVKFFQTASDDMLGYYLEHNAGDLSEEAEKILLLSGKEKLIEAYFDKNTLYFDNEEILINGNNDEAFKYYIGKYALREEHESMLVQSQNKMRMFWYLGKYRFSPYAEELFILSGDRGIIKGYHQKWRFHDSSWKVLLEKFFLENY